MDILKKKQELINLISGYLDNRVTSDDLRKFSWEMIHFFSKNKSELPPYQDFENEFWYTIWQIQHLVDAEHEKENVTNKILLDALDYLKSKKKMPVTFIGKRP